MRSKSKKTIQADDEVVHTTRLEPNVTPTFNFESAQSGEASAVPQKPQENVRIAELENQLADMKAFMETLFAEKSRKAAQSQGEEA